MINRPDRPLGKIQRSRRKVDHPDRAAHLKERADGAHAEFEDALNDPSSRPEAVSDEDVHNEGVNEDEPRR